MYASFACMYVCAVHTCSAHRDGKRVIDPLGLELQMFVSHHVGSGNQIKSSGRSDTAFKCFAISPAPENAFICLFLKIYIVTFLVAVPKHPIRSK